MRSVIVGGLCVSALALSACATRVDYNGFEAASTGGAPLRALAVLDCPTTEGQLTRVSRSDDGRTCGYEGPIGESVWLKLVPLEGRSATDVLEPARAELRMLVPVTLARVEPVAKDEPGEHTNIDLPFFHIHTAGDHADLKVFGVKVVSAGQNADVKTHLGGVHTIVHASPDGAEVITEDVGRTNASLVYVLASEKRAPSGYRAVGYVARGPAAGPLVVGEFRAPGSAQATYHSDVRSGFRGHVDNGDLDRLIDLNLKG
jgi:hypothetical protein